MARLTVLNRLAAARPSQLSACLFLLLLPFAFFWRETLGLRTLGDQDAVFWFFPAYHQVVEQLRALHLPLWNPYVFGGMPLFAAWQAGVLDPLNLIYLATGVSSRSVTLTQQLSFSLAALSTFAYARTIGIGRRGSVAAAVIYTFGGYLVARTLYPGLLHVTALAPLVLFLVEKAFRESSGLRGWRLAILGALVVAWQIFAAHPQPLVYSSLLAVAYVLFRAFASGLYGTRRLRFLAQSGLVFVGGIGLAGVQLLPAFEFAMNSVRQSWSFEMFTVHSLHPITILGAVIPFLHGGGEGIYHLKFWGPYWHHNEAQIYLGVLVISFAVAGMIGACRPRDRVGMFWSGAALAGVILALGKYSGPVAWLLYHVPGINGFRSPNRYWMVVALAAAILAGYAIDRISTDTESSLGRVALTVSSALTLLIALVATVVALRPQLAEMLIGMTTGNFPAGLLGGARAEFLVPLVSAALTTLVILVFVKTHRKYRYYLLLAALLVDLNLYAAFAPTGTNWNIEERLGRALPSPIERMKSGRSHLVINPAAGEFSPLLFYGHEMATGYDPLLNARYKRFAGIDEAGRSHLTSLLGANDRTLDLLNVRQVIVAPGILEESSVDENALAYRSDLVQSGRWREIGKLSEAAAYRDYQFFENLRVLPAAWLVKNVRIANSEDQLKLIRGEAGGFDPLDTALVPPEDASGEISGLEASRTTGNVAVVEKTPGKIILDAEAAESSLLVVSEIFDAGWIARVDGEPRRVLQVDYMLRGVVLPAGKHRVELSYEPRSLKVGFGVSVVTALFLIGIFVVKGRSRE